MKILWLVNIPLPEVGLLMDGKVSPFGGWLVNSSKELSVQDGIELTIVFPKKGIDSYSKIAGENIIYYAFKPILDKHMKKKHSTSVLSGILNEVKPDLVHIYGTEMAHTISMVEICKKKNIKTVISIQGLVSIIAKHMNAGLPWKVIYGVTLRNILRKDNVIGLQKKLNTRGKREIEAIKNVENAIGRTSWDKACTVQINPNINYHHCNETLREEFYNNEWDSSKCEKHTLFLSQAHYPIKGLHFVIEAMIIILRRFPNTKLYISGKNIIKSDKVYDQLLMTYYARYIKYLIKKYNMSENIKFTGELNEQEMCKQFLKSHVFISSSTIENESNSLSEAKILGVPSVVSYVGGVIDRVDHSVDGFLYQHDAPYMLANYICELFGDDNLTRQFSENSRKAARKTYNKQINTNRLVQIYKEITE